MQKIGNIANSDALANEFTEGDAQNAIPATVLKAGWLNTVQRELVALVEHQGGALDANDDAQVLAAIRNIAQGAGFVTLDGQIGKGAGNTLNLPSGLINIGGNGLGYRLDAEVDWNPLGVANNDGSFNALNLGDNIYVYAVQQASGVGKWLASVNATVPSGYTADNSRKVGGFHYGRTRPRASRYNTGYAPATEIVSNSCWDLLHRPKCDPTGMVEVIPGRVWVDIYLSSVVSGSWPDTVVGSVYNATPLQGTTYTPIDMALLLANVGKRLPTTFEFLAYAEGAPQGENAANTYAWANNANVAPTTTGAVAKAVSVKNVVDAVGNMEELLGDFLNSGTGYASSNAELSIGQDNAQARGIIYRADLRLWSGGGGYDTGAYAGAGALRFVYANNSAHWGLRGACEAK